MPIYKENKPSADVLMVSMRAMGYSFEAAIADVLDNSISVSAKRIEIKFPVDPSKCIVAICDNGTGMDSEELFDAMKYGSKFKKGQRSEKDLGRFGIGMKAASLSQCRKLTVISKKNGKLSALCWDLDVIASESNMEWAVAEYSLKEIRNLSYVEFLADLENGTVILWENFDLIEKSSGSVFYELEKYKETTANYLSLIFHRYINKEQPDAVDIYINEFKIPGVDPFLEKHKKTNPRRSIKLPVTDSYGVEQNICVQAYVLPFQKDLSKEDMKLLGGVEEYHTKQGFYIYRNERLIVWGTWFGRPKNELTKHARVKVDIPNSLDDIWGIDIKKQKATIPRIIRNQLTKVVDEAMDIAVKEQTFRGRIEKINENTDYIWNRIEERENHYFYKINRESKIFDLVKDDVDDATWSKIEMLFEEIENGVPYQQIYIDKSQNRLIDEISEQRLAEVESKAEILISMAAKLGQNDRKIIVDQLFHSEPFCKYPSLKNKLLEEEK